jgi:hypothetical protein
MGKVFVGKRVWIHVDTEDHGRRVYGQEMQSCRLHLKQNAAGRTREWSGCRVSRVEKVASQGLFHRRNVVLADQSILLPESCLRCVDLGVIVVAATRRCI